MKTDRLLTYNDRSEVYVYDEAKKTVRLGSKDDIDPDNPKQRLLSETAITKHMNRL